MRLDFSGLSSLQAYRWLTASVVPRPVAWVSTCSAAGISNLAPFSFFQVVSDQPATLMVNVGQREDGSAKDTLRNVRERPELVVHIVNHACAERMNATAATLPGDISEFEHCVIESMACERIAVPRVVQAPIAFECRVVDIHPYPPGPAPRHHLIFAEVLLAHIHDEVLDEQGRIDPLRLDAIGRLGGSAYCRTHDLFRLQRP